MTEEAISIENGSIDIPIWSGAFGRTTRYIHVLDRVSLTLHDNETIALVGESGSGKTTFGASIMGLRELSGGVVRWRKRPLPELAGRDKLAFRRDVQAIFQDPYASLNPRHTIRETLLRPLRLHRIVPAREMAGYAEHLLDTVGLRPARLYIDRYPHEFSGGQRQRIAIARALTVKPRILVADEPVSALDVSIRTQILNLFKKLKSELQLSMLFLSHDLGVVRFIADRVAVMYLGKIVELGPVQSVFENPNHPYTRILLTSAPSVRRGTGGATIASLEPKGEPPPPTNPPPGCRFHTRCPFAFDRCRVEVPALAPVGTDHTSACHLND
jgi:peptide/nickel transport system ATP-binding protein/oligopeptide transport system ATP-binding protein